MSDNTIKTTDGAEVFRNGSNAAVMETPLQKVLTMGDLSGIWSLLCKMKYQGK